MLVWLSLQAILIECLLVLVRLRGDPRSHVVGTIALLLIASVFYCIATYLVLRTQKNEVRRTLWILLWAIVFRITVWPVFPAFSDDVYRYRWEGKLQGVGGNPYQARPNDSQWSGLRDETFPRVVGRDFKAGYGPLTELIERASWSVIAALTSDSHRQVFWFKSPAALFDLGIIAALAAWLRARALPLERVAVYAWSPLAIFAFWIDGHNDSIAVFFLVLALAFSRPLPRFAALGAAIAAKLWPVLLLPAFLRVSGRRWFHAAIIVPLIAVCWWPYRSNIVENAQFMSGFAGGWRNNDSLFGLLLWLCSGDVYHAKYLAIGLMGLLGAAGLLACKRASALPRVALVIVAGTLLLAANCHPWYLTWFLPLLAVEPSAPLLLWMALVPLAYSVVIGWSILGEWNGSTGLRWLIYVPVLTWLSVLAVRRVLAKYNKSAQCS